jgi:pimeloyl-ACP methyl ester carboxylesterase
MSQGGPIAIAYAARHRERVRRMVFYGSYAARMRNPTAEDIEFRDTMEQMVRVGWALAPHREAAHGLADGYAAVY